MKRLIANILVAAGGLTASSQLLALGLGELTLQSALNQPLRAEIELVDSKGLTEWEIKPALASQADFERAGVEREFFLTSISFKVEGNRIVLSSREPVNEPFLNFLVELNWPSGRVLREYTLLLDPPVFEETSYQPAVKAPAAVAETVDVPVQSAPAAVNRWDSEPAAAGTYKVKKDDTLWDIALQTRPSAAITAQQMMIALQQQNPDAFIGGNINRLKSHQVLRIPDEDTVRAVAFNQAVAEVARQNRALKPGVAQIDATGRGGHAAVAKAGKEGGEVRLLSAGGEEAESAGAAGEVANGLGAGRQQALENDLVIALENVDKGRRENEELRKRLESLEEQINTLQRLISLKDDQLAGMQVPQQEAAAETTAPVSETEAAEPAAVDFNYTAPVAETVAEGAVADGASEDGTAASTEESTEESAEAVAAREAAEAKARRDRIAAMIAEQEQQQRAQPTLLDELMANPLIPAAAVALLLLLVLLLVRVLKKRKEAAAADDEGFDEQDLAEFNAADLDDSALDEFDFEDDNLHDNRTAVVQSPAVEDEMHEEHFETVAQTEDAISESDIYIAYGKFEQAVDLLQSAIEEEPSRTDLRLKLLEVYVEMDDSRAFATAEAELASLGDRAAVDEARNMRQRLSSPLEPAVAGLAGGVVGGAAAASALSLDDDIPELDADLGDEFADGMDFGDALDMGDESTEVVSLTSAADNDVPVLESGLDDSATDALDFDFDIGGDEAPLSAEESQPVAQAVDNGLDFDISEFAMDDDAADVAVSETTESAAAADDLLAFDLGSLNESDVAAEPATMAAGSEDDLLDFDLANINDASDELSAAETILDAEAEQTDDNALAMDSLESLLDGETEGDSDLTDLSFDMDEPTGFAESGNGEDLAALDSELDASLSSEDDLSSDLASLSDDLGDLTDTEDAFSLDDEFSLDDVPALTEESEAAAGDFSLDDVPALTEESEAAADDFSLDDVPALTDAADVAVADSAAAGEIDLDQLAAADDEFDFLAGTDECATKLDLARAYIDMEDLDGARELLQEVIQEGSDQQKTDARSLLSNMA